MQMSIYKILITLLFWAAAFQTFAQSGTSGERLLLIAVTDRQQNEPLSYASCVLLAEDGRTYSGLTGDDGVAAFSQIPEGRYALSIYYMGQTFRMEITVNSTASQHIYAKIEYDPIQLDEVYAIYSLRASQTCWNCCPEAARQTPISPLRKASVCVKPLPLERITTPLRSELSSL